MTDIPAHFARCPGCGSEDIMLPPRDEYGDFVPDMDAVCATCGYCFGPRSPEPPPLTLSEACRRLQSLQDLTRETKDGG